jgi:hypothetical protein
MFAMFAAVCLLVPRAAAVCGQPQPRLVCAEYFKSRVVVKARLIRSKYVAPLNDIDGHFYEMRTENIFRGNIGKSFQVWEENSNGRAGFIWKPGRSYILFLYELFENGGWLLDGCGNSGPVETRQKTLEKIEAIDPTSQRALITGAVGFADPVGGIQVEASGPTGQTTATTKSDGTFEIHVPPGKYQVRAFGLGKTFVAEDLTYEHPDSLVVEGGGCAQIQFVDARSSR